MMKRYNIITYCCIGLSRNIRSLFVPHDFELPKLFLHLTVHQNLFVFSQLPRQVLLLFRILNYGFAGSFGYLILNLDFTSPLGYLALDGLQILNDVVLCFALFALYVSRPVVAHSLLYQLFNILVLHLIGVLFGDYHILQAPKVPLVDLLPPPHHNFLRPTVQIALYPVYLFELVNFPIFQKQLDVVV